MRRVISVSSYIKSIIETKLNESGRKYVIYDTADEIPRELSDLPQVENTIYGVVKLSVKSRSELIEVHNVTYTVNLDFIVPAQLSKEYQQDMNLLKDLETPINLISYSLKMIFPVSARWQSQSVNGQYWMIYGVMGEAIEFNGLTFGEDVELYYMLNEDECVQPTENPNDYIGTAKESTDGSIWSGVIDFYDWQETEDVISSPTYSVDNFGDLPQAQSGESAKVASGFEWGSVTKIQPDYGYIKDTLANLGIPLAKNINAVATGYNLINSSDIEWLSGYEIQWVEQTLLNDPFNYDVNLVSVLPTPTVTGLKARVSTNDYVEVTKHKADRGFIHYELTDMPTGYANVGKKAIILGYEAVLSDLFEFNSLPNQYTITADSTYDRNDYEDMLFLLQDQLDNFSTLHTNYADIGIRMTTGGAYTYWKFVSYTDAPTKYYTYTNTSVSYYLSSYAEIRPRITITAFEDDNNVFWQQLYEESVFDDLISFYDNLGVIRINLGTTFVYRKLQEVNRLGNAYYTSSVSDFTYYYAEPSASWHFVNSGVGELIDIESFDDGVNFTVSNELIDNTEESIKEKRAFYTEANSTLGFTKIFNPQSTFDNILLKSRHNKTSPQQIVIKFKYNASVFSALSPLEYIEPYYIVNVSRNRSKRTIGMITVSLAYGELL